MHRSSDTIIINRHIQEVFNYITTPSHWPAFNEAVVSVEPAIAHSFKPGDPDFIETAKVLMFVNVIRYRAITNDPPNIFTVKGTSDSFGGGNTECTYSCTRIDDNTTLFKREFSYAYNHFLMRIVSKLFLNRLIKKKGTHSLGVIKQKLEEQPL